MHTSPTYVVSNATVNPKQQTILAELEIHLDETNPKYFEELDEEILVTLRKNLSTVPDEEIHKFVKTLGADQQARYIALQHKFNAIAAKALSEKLQSLKSLLSSDDEKINKTIPDGIIRNYRQLLSEIPDDVTTSFIATLSAEQQKRFELLQKRISELQDSKKEAAPTPVASGGFLSRAYNLVTNPFGGSNPQSPAAPLAASSPVSSGSTPTAATSENTTTPGNTATSNTPEAATTASNNNATSPAPQAAAAPLTGTTSTTAPDSPKTDEISAAKAKDKQEWEAKKKAEEEAKLQAAQAEAARLRAESEARIQAAQAEAARLRAAARATIDAAYGDDVFPVLTHQQQEQVIAAYMPGGGGQPAIPEETRRAIFHKMEY